MITKVILEKIFSVMGTEKENINDKVEATVGVLYFITFVIVAYVVVCVAYD